MAQHTAWWWASLADSFRGQAPAAAHAHVHATQHIPLLRAAALHVQVRCLNEAQAGSCRGVFKPWPARLTQTEPPLRSNDDDEDSEVLLHVP